MPTATARRRAAPAPADTAPERVAAAVLTLLAAVERHAPGAPAALAFRAALARRGREIAQAGGPAALADIRARVRAADPARADARGALLDAAWGEPLAPAA